MVRMRSRPPAFFVALALVLGSAASVCGGIQILDFRYQLVGYERSEEWYEIEIELDVTRDRDDLTSRNPRFVEGVTVALQLAHEARRREGRAFEFFEASVTFVALEEGRRLARFYLPPEVVRRDGISGAPHSFLVQVLQRETALDVSASSSLADESVRQSFASRVGPGAAANRGALRPQWQTPFATLYSDSTPTELRELAPSP